MKFVQSRTSFIQSGFALYKRFSFYNGKDSVNNTCIMPTALGQGVGSTGLGRLSFGWI